jgi:divalent metal cation (Fe/Co/Zn/Cd) transporter
METSFDSRNDVIATSSVLIEAVITYFTGFNLDGYMGAVVALFILVTGIRLVMDTVSPLLGVAPTRVMVERIYKKILNYEGILGLHDLAVHNYGPLKCFASVHCEVAAEQDIMISHDIIDNIERDFLKDEGIHLVIHLDPIITENEKINDLRDKVEKIIEELSTEIGMHDFRVVKGVTHTNLIFDVVVPYEFKWSDGELVTLISDEISKINETYRSVIMVDHDYVPNNGDKH